LIWNLHNRRIDGIFCRSSSESTRGHAANVTATKLFGKLQS
jgi:hypothetical protein